MKLVWYQRKDGLWNAACACHATVIGIAYEQRTAAEAEHFRAANAERTRRAKEPVSFERSQIPSCGPKLPEPNPNLPDPFVFP